MVKRGADIFVIGAGSMAEAFIRGVTRGGVVPPEQIRVINKSRRDRIENLVTAYGVREASGWADIENAGLIVLSVKPVDVSDALSSAAPYLNGQPMISFAAGVSLKQLEQNSNHRAVAIRTMPNLPVSVSEGTTAVAFSPQVNLQEQEFTLRLLAQLGDTIEIPEDLMDAVTAISGSGPGFICYFLEAMESAATSLGLTPEVARRMLFQTLTGTIRTLDEWKLSPKDLRERVTSPGGTTFAGVEVMEKLDVHSAVGLAIVAAKERSAQLGEALLQQ